MMYKLSDVRQVCEAYYGRKISKRTWIYWKQLANVPEYSREVTEQKASHVFAVAVLRRQFPNKKITFVDVFKTALTELPKIKEQLQNPKVKLATESCKGTDLIGYLMETTGRVISERTLYRWGSHYGIPYKRDKIYESEQLNQWEILAKTVTA